MFKGKNIGDRCKGVDCNDEPKRSKVHNLCTRIDMDEKIMDEAKKWIQKKIKEIEKNQLERDKEMRAEGFNAARKTKGYGLAFTYSYDDSEEYEKKRKK